MIDRKTKYFYRIKDLPFLPKQLNIFIIFLQNKIYSDNIHIVSIIVEQKTNALSVRFIVIKII